MAAPNELLDTINLYRECDSYRDKGMILRTVGSGITSFDSMEFTTEFKRGEKLLITGRAFDGHHDIYSSADQAFQTMFVDSWSFNYDGQVAAFEALLQNQQRFSQSDRNMDPIFTIANRASHGCASIVPSHLLYPSVLQGALDLTEHFNYEEIQRQPEESILLVRGQSPKSSQVVEIHIDDKTRLFQKVRLIRKLKVDYQIELLEKARTILEASGDSGAAETTRYAMELLSSKPEVGSLDISYVYSDVEVDE